MLLLIGLFVALLVLRVPVGFALLGSSVAYFVVHGIPLQMAAQRLAIGVDSFPLLAVPFFIMAGSAMNSVGITRRLFDFADHLVGHFTGGLGHANILASVIFSGMSGAAIADAGGLGQIELQAMKEAGYDDDFSLAITGASSIIGPIIPPSVPAVIFAVTAGVSTGRLFAGGVVPGLLMALALSTKVYFTCKRRNYPRRTRATLRELVSATKTAFLGLMAPVIIIGGILVGVFTPTEAAIVAVFYSILMGFYYRSMTLADLPRLIRETLGITVAVFFIVASAALFGLILTISQVPQQLAVSFTQAVPNKHLALLMINCFLLLVGCFMEPTAALMILVPILMPITRSYGIDPIHFGIIMILNLMIGLLTPPVGMVLYVLSSVSKVPFERIARAVFPDVLTLVAVLLLITFLPDLVTFVPNLVFGR
jgi:tripartite ATP-independent transporter DctM subunit